MVAAPELLTSDQQIRLLSEGALYEIADEQVVEVPGMGQIATRCANRLAFQINQHAYPLGTARSTKRMPPTAGCFASSTL